MDIKFNTEPGEVEIIHQIVDRVRELLDAPDFDFSHDVFGIMRHINRETGQLESCFLPRYARGEAVHA